MKVDTKALEEAINMSIDNKVLILYKQIFKIKSSVLCRDFPHMGIFLAMNLKSKFTAFVLSFIYFKCYMLHNNQITSYNV